MKNTLFAVVDIETTGSFAGANGITEVAVFVTDGQKVIERYHSLVNPQCKIPRFVEGLTGITQQMVEEAPCFEHIALDLYQILHDKIFVAHNVNFDFSFLKFHFNKAGYQLNCKKLCTIRYSRKLIPGLPGYGLDKICRHLCIEIAGRHRASGDAEATATLLHLLLRDDKKNVLSKMLQTNSGEQCLPPNLPASEISKLPQTAGVYYFLDKKEKVIYVGKAVNIQRRVKSHFANNSARNQKQEFLKSIYQVRFQETGTELMALIQESVEIKRLWPGQNKSQKRFEPSYGLYSFVDSNGYMRLFIDKKKKNVRPIVTFYVLSEGYQMLRKLIREYQLCASLCFLSKGDKCKTPCKGACRKEEDPHEYNQRVEESFQLLEEDTATYVLLDKGVQYDERSCVLVENGRFYGMGFIGRNETFSYLEDFKNAIQVCQDNEYLRSIVKRYADKHPEKKVVFDHARSESVNTAV